MKGKDACVVRKGENESAVKTVTFYVDDIVHFFFRGQGFADVVHLRLREGDVMVGEAQFMVVMNSLG